LHSFQIAQAAAESTATGSAAGHAAESGGGITLGEHWLATVGGYHLHVDTVLYTAIVMALILIVFALLGSTVNRKPTEQSGATGTVIEEIVEFCQKIVRDFVGAHTTPYLWYIGAIFIFVLVANWLALLPWEAWKTWVGEPLAAQLHAPIPLVYEAPTGDLNTTAGLAILSLIMYWIYGIAKNGIGGFIHHHWFAKPVVLFPLRILEDFTRPLGLSLRLFANMTAGHVVGLVLLMLVPFILPAVMLPLEMFIGAVQAFIFATLSAAYIGAATAEDHH
jgi:F-type H+-transporting ATPase subunit a